MAAHHDFWVYVPNSKVPGFPGEVARIAVRRIRPDLPPGKKADLQVVMVGGRSIPARAAFDLQSSAKGGGYSWARKIADSCRADVWIMDVQGMGQSSRPGGPNGPMGDPCNILKPDQARAFVPNSVCDPRWQGCFSGSDAEWQELDAVVDHVLNVAIQENPQRWMYELPAQVVLIGYSAGANVVAPYAMQHPSKVWGLLLLAPVFNPGSLTDKPSPFPVKIPPHLFGAPMGIVTRESIWPFLFSDCGVEKNNPDVFNDLWQAVRQEEQTPDMIPRENLKDPYGGYFLFPTRYWWGWNPKALETDYRLGRHVPVLIIAGTNDKTIRGLPSEEGVPAPPFDIESLWNAMGGRHQTMMYDIECASHNIVWQEPDPLKGTGGRGALHEASIPWLKAFSDYVGPPELTERLREPVPNPRFRPLYLPHGGSGRYLVSGRPGDRHREWDGQEFYDPRGSGRRPGDPPGVRRDRNGRIILPDR